MTSDPIARKVTRWVCPHCTRGWSKRPAAVTHIASCWRNPEAHGCLTCEHFRPYDGEPEVGWIGDEEHCGEGLPLPEDPRREGHRTLAVHCPKWSPE